MTTSELQGLVQEIDSAFNNLDCAGKAALNFIEHLRESASIQEEKFELNTTTPQISHDVGPLIRDVDTLISGGLLLNAELIAKAALAMNGPPSIFVKKLAEIYELQSDYRKTVALAHKLLVKYPGEAELIYQLSFALYKLGSPDEALEYLLPLVAQDPSPRSYRLCGLLLHSLGQASDAIDMLESAIKANQDDHFSIRALSRIYVDLGMYDKAIAILDSIPESLVHDDDRLAKPLIYRLMGELDHAILLNQNVIEQLPDYANAYWTQCFNLSISAADRSTELISLSRQFWELAGVSANTGDYSSPNALSSQRAKIKIGFLSSDIGEHVVSRFLLPIIRQYDKSKYSIVILSTARRFEQRATDIICFADDAVSLQANDTASSVQHLRDLALDVIIDTNGFTRNSGLPLLSARCAPIQCHYIGYHATTGLNTIDYFLGDKATTPTEFQSQFTEKLVQIPSLWIAYDSRLEFPVATTATQRRSPVLGSFSQIAKVNGLTLQYWAAAMKACPDSILVIKDRGVHCQITCLRIETALEKQGVDPSRIYLFGPVASQLEHLGCYNAIDIALDTTPWSGATTAFEALGMGVPLVSICGDSTSGRMSTSVVSAAGMSHLITSSIDEFATCVAALASNYKKIRANKTTMQKVVRSGILFDEERISRDFFSTIDRLLSESSAID